MLFHGAHPVDQVSSDSPSMVQSGLRNSNGWSRSEKPVDLDLVFVGMRGGRGSLKMLGLSVWCFDSEGEEMGKVGGWIGRREDCVS
jgi:hypothetical protein